MLLEFKSFAQFPGDEDENNGLEGGDGDPPVPIDSPKIFILLLLGIVFVYCHFKKINTLKKTHYEKI